MNIKFIGLKEGKTIVNAFNFRFYIDTDDKKFIIDRGMLVFEFCKCIIYDISKQKFREKSMDFLYAWVESIVNEHKYKHSDSIKIDFYDLLDGVVRISSSVCLEYENNYVRLLDNWFYIKSSYFGNKFRREIVCDLLDDCRLKVIVNLRIRLTQLKEHNGACIFILNIRDNVIENYSIWDRYDDCMRDLKELTVSDKNIVNDINEIYDDKIRDAVRKYVGVAKLTKIQMLG